MGTVQLYASLARQWPARQLTDALLRRARRRMSQRFARSSPVSEERILQAYGVDSGCELAAKALDDVAGNSWAFPWRHSSIALAVRSIPGAVERALRRADDAANRRFDVFGTKVEFGKAGRTDWYLDVRSGHRYPMVDARRIALLEGKSDPKYPWVLGRLDHLIALAQGHVLQSALRRDGSEAWAECFREELSDFLAQNPVGVGIHWTCPMEVALRAANIAQALHAFGSVAAVREPRFLVRALVALVEHAQFVARNLEDDGLVPNNHLVADAVGLLAVGALFPRLPGAEMHVATGVRLLESAMQSQVHEDGSSFEGSIPYHRLSLELFAMAYAIAKGQGIALSDGFRQRLERMFFVARALTSSSGRLAQLGDNDSGRALPFTDRAELDGSYLAPLGAALLSAPSLKGPRDGFSDEAAWLLGSEGQRTFERLEPRAVDSAFLSEEGGWAVLRGSGATLTVSVGGAAQLGINGHAHQDKLGFELELDGVPVIVDPGTGTYSRDAELRNQLRASRAHSVLEVDAQPQALTDPGRLFAAASATARVVLFDAKGDIERLTADHDGYRRLPSPVTVERAFCLDRSCAALTITEAIRGRGLHVVHTRVPLRDKNARLRRTRPEEVRRASRAFSAPHVWAEQALEIGDVEEPRAVVLFERGWRLQLEPALFSPGYGRTSSALILVAERSMIAPARAAWAVLWSSGTNELRPISLSASQMYDGPHTSSL